MTTNSEPVSIPTYPDLAGKVAVVTGGSKGIGAATCRAARAQRRAGGGLRARPGDDRERHAETRDAGAAEAVGIAADLTTPDGVARLRAEVEDGLGTDRDR